ncbi:unnamed protein product [Linum trigynum]|uniref:Uncharacterized protein n=1 Tax=Linum trigynum TaxID=586398 RepID=A0AAV2DXP8_9ROSI
MTKKVMNSLTRLIAARVVYTRPKPSWEPNLRKVKAVDARTKAPIRLGNKSTRVEEKMVKPKGRLRKGTTRPSAMGLEGEGSEKIIPSPPGEDPVSRVGDKALGGQTESFSATSPSEDDIHSFEVRKRVPDEPGANRRCTTKGHVCQVVAAFESGLSIKGDEHGAKEMLPPAHDKEEKTPSVMDESWSWIPDWTGRLNRENRKPGQIQNDKLNMGRLPCRPVFAVESACSEIPDDFDHCRREEESLESTTLTSPTHLHLPLHHHSPAIAETQLPLAN